MSVTTVNAGFDGRVTVQVELQLPNNKFIPFDDINVIHVSSSIRESVKGSSSHELVVRTPTTDYIDTVLRAVQSKGTPKVRYRVGVGFSGNFVFLPWQEQIISNFSAVLEGVGVTAGHFIRMDLKDILFTMSRSTKVISRRGSIGDIVRQIAIENGINATVIEPTLGEGLWIQSFVDDEDFVRRRLVHRAVNKKGRGNYNFFVQDNALHFHTPDYQAQLKELIYYQTNSIGLTQLDESQPMLEYGASNVRVVSYDPYTASISEISSDPNKALRFGNVITPLTAIPGADLNLPFHISTNSSQEAVNMAQAVYENARSQTLGLKIDLGRSIFLRIGDLVRITITPSSSRNSVWSGMYFVTDASYQIENGAMVSIFVVKRGEYQTNKMSPTQVSLLGSSLIVSDQDAPGQPINLKLAEHSDLTHGTGKSSYTSIFVDTQDTNTAPNPNPKV